MGSVEIPGIYICVYIYICPNLLFFEEDYLIHHLKLGGTNMWTNPHHGKTHIQEIPGSWSWCRLTLPVSPQSHVLYGSLFRWLSGCEFWAIFRPEKDTRWLHFKSDQPICELVGLQRITQSQITIGVSYDIWESGNHQLRFQWLPQSVLVSQCFLHVSISFWHWQVALWKEAKGPHHDYLAVSLSDFSGGFNAQYESIGIIPTSTRSNQRHQDSSAIKRPSLVNGTLGLKFVFACAVLLSYGNMTKIFENPGADDHLPMFLLECASIFQKHAWGCLKI